MTRLEIDINYDTEKREYHCAWRTLSCKSPRIQGMKERELAVNVEMCVENYLNGLAKEGVSPNG